MRRENLLTEDEAARRYCPFALGGGAVSALFGTCQVSHCMAWRCYPMGDDDGNEVTMYGYCALIERAGGAQ